MSNQQGRIQSRRNESAASTLPEIGKVKIGIKNPDKGYPMSLDYFRPTGNFANEFTNKYGDKPTRLSVCFISDNLQEVCNERYEAWVKGKRWGFGDGTVFTVWDAQADGGKGAYVNDVPAADPRVKALKWDIMLTLRFVLLELKGIMGYWSFQTKAKATTIPSVVKAFDYVRERAGTIVGFPFSLLVEKKTGYSPGEAKNYPVVTLVPNFSEDAIELVNSYLEAGGNVNKLTTAMIQQKAVLQIEAPKIEGGGK